MGATNCPETPRQKMISMMYLVYTALLALNVSVQILDGYKLVNGSLKTSIEIADASKASLDKSFAKELANNQAKFAKPFKAYENINKEANDVISYIDQIKRDIIKGIDNGDGTIDTLSDGGLGELNIPSVYWKQNIATNGESKPGKLQEAVEKFKKAAIAACLAQKIDTTDVSKTFTMKSQKTETGTRTWEARMFEDMPAIACITMLTKTENDIRNTQVQLGKALLGSADQEDVRVNKMEAVVVANSGYVMRGGKYEAKIILAALDSTKKPDIYVGSSKLGADGKYTVGASGVGNKTYSGYIEVKQKDGTAKKYPFKGEYTVGEPSATISPEMLNVVYAGYPNPMAVSCPGVSSSDLQVSFSNVASQSKKGDGTFVIVPKNPGSNCEVIVTAKIDGKAQRMGSKTFRILPLPPPLAFLKTSAGLIDGKNAIGKGVAGSATEVVAQLNSDLLKNVHYTVQQFSMKFVGAMDMVVKPAQGSHVTSDQLASIRSLRPGKSFFISGCIAKGPDGKSHKLPAVEITIK